jgi:diadenosine tetraphosphate (Ap4A) HIT family hydrolase
VEGDAAGSGFELDARLARDTLPVAEWPLCRLLLSRNADHPWFLLVPRRSGLRELHHLDPAAQARLWAESARLAAAMEAAFRPDALNVAKLGNLVPQLHLHHVARYRGDPAWPGPVWGVPPGREHDRESAAATVAALLAALPAEDA